MKFRITLPQASPIVLDLPTLTDASTVDEMVNNILLSDQIPTSLKQCAISIKAGFPPQKIDIHQNAQATLKSLKISNGEKLILEEDTNGPKILKGTRYVLYGSDLFKIPDSIGPYVPPSNNAGTLHDGLQMFI